NFPDTKRILNSRLKPKLLVAAVVVRCYESALNFLEVFFAFSSTANYSISVVFLNTFLRPVR
ncbi:hypothetical protein, partial [Flavobacterium psychrophilum]